MLQFVNVSAPTKKDVKENRKLVRSHVMKDYRQRQREHRQVLKDSHLATTEASKATPLTPSTTAQNIQPQQPDAPSYGSPTASPGIGGISLPTPTPTVPQSIPNEETAQYISENQNVVFPRHPRSQVTPWVHERPDKRINRTKRRRRSKATIREHPDNDDEQDVHRNRPEPAAKRLLRSLLWQGDIGHVAQDLSPLLVCQMTVMILQRAFHPVTAQVQLHHDLEPTLITADINWLNPVAEGFQESSPILGSWELHGNGMLISAASLCSITHTSCVDEYLSSGMDLYYKAKTLRYVNDQMKNPDTAINDDTICAVMCLSSFETATGSGIPGTHIKGLERMIRMRGGLEKLGYEGTLAPMVAAQDILYAVLENRPPILSELDAPKFRSDHLNPNGDIFVMSSPLLYQEDFAGLHHKCPETIDQEAAQLLSDAFIVTSTRFTASRSGRQSLPASVNATHQRIAERLFSKSADTPHPEASRRPSRFTKAIRLAAMIHFRAAACGIPYRDKVNADDATRLGTLLKRIHGHSWGSASFLYLWVILTGGAAGGAGPLRPYFAAELKRVVLGMGYFYHDIIKQIVSNFLWLQAEVRALSTIENTRRTPEGSSRLHKENPIRQTMSGNAWTTSPTSHWLFEYNCSRANPEAHTEIPPTPEEETRPAITAQPSAFNMRFISPTKGNSRMSIMASNLEDLNGLLCLPSAPVPAFNHTERNATQPESPPPSYEEAVADTATFTSSSTRGDASDTSTPKKTNPHLDGPHPITSSIHPFNHASSPPSHYYPSIDPLLVNSITSTTTQPGPPFAATLPYSIPPTRQTQEVLDSIPRIAELLRNQREVTITSRDSSISVTFSPRKIIGEV